MNPEIYLHLADLSIGYSNNSILSGINLSIERGKLCVLIGRNGSGKTTLFKTLSGIISPISGQFFVKGQNIFEINESDRSKLISQVLTTKPIVAGFSVYSIVAMGRHPYLGSLGKLDSKDEGIIEKALKSMNLLDLRDKSIDQISDGEFQKMMIARALAQDTEIIFMDEPTSFLDYPSKVELIDQLSFIASELDKTIIFSSHEIPLLINKVDHIIGISGNKVHFNSRAQDESIFKEILEY